MSDKFIENHVAVVIRRYANGQRLEDFETAYATYTELEKALDKAQNGKNTTKAWQVAYDYGQSAIDLFVLAFRLLNLIHDGIKSAIGELSTGLKASEMELNNVKKLYSERAVSRKEFMDDSQDIQVVFAERSAKLGPLTQKLATLRVTIRALKGRGQTLFPEPDAAMKNQMSSNPTRHAAPVDLIGRRGEPFFVQGHSDRLEYFANTVVKGMDVRIGVMDNAKERAAERAQRKEIRNEQQERLDVVMENRRKAKSTVDGQEVKAVPSVHESITVPEEE